MGHSFGVLVVVVLICDTIIIVISEIPTYYQKYFHQNQIFFFSVGFYAFILRMEEDKILNPFGYLEATKVLDENRKPVDWWMQYLEFNQAVEENEFYVLFADGLLVKKGRSKYKSSQYTFGDEYKSFKQYYDEKKTFKNDSNDNWYFIAHGIIDENNK